MRPRSSDIRKNAEPATYVMDPEQVSDNLDYVEMIVLAEAFAQWALTSPMLSPSARTELIQWASDIEGIAAWCSPGWKAPYPQYPETVLKVTARKLLCEVSAGNRSLGRFFKVSEWSW